MKFIEVTDINGDSHLVAVDLIIHVAEDQYGDARRIYFRDGEQLRVTDHYDDLKDEITEATT